MSRADASGSARAGTGGESSGSLSLRLLGRLVLQYAPTSLLPAAAGLLSIIVFTRVLDAAAYGRYSLALSGSILVTSLCSQWLQHGINRYLPAARRAHAIRDTKGGASVALVALLLVESAFGGALLGISPWFGPEWRAVILPAVALTLATSTFWPLGAVLQAELRAGRYSLYHSANAVLRFGLAVALVHLVAPTPASLLWGFVVATLVVIPLAWRDAGMPSLGWMRRHVGRLSAESARLARYGMPMAGWVLAATLLEFGDRYVIQFARGSAEMGVYAANYTLVSAGVGLVAAPIILAAHPFLMRAWEEADPVEAGRWLSRIAEWFSLAGIVLVALVSLFARDLAHLFLGAEFREGYPIIPIVLAGTILWQLGMYTHKPLEFAGRTRLLFGLSIFTAAVNIALNVALVPRFGYQAAAYTTLASYALYVALTTRAGRSVLPWAVYWRRLGGALAGSLLVAALIAWIRMWVEHRFGYLAGLSGAVALSAAACGALALHTLPLLLLAIRGRGAREGAVVRNQGGRKP